jgi:poly-gamma-glutamate synthesis protein (capsule biosynthesis protein)
LQTSNTITQTPTPFQPVPPTPLFEETTNTPSPLPTANPTTNLPADTLAKSFWIDTTVPEGAKNKITLPSDFVTAANKNSASLVITTSKDQVISEWMYVLVAPFPTITDNISEKQLLEIWSGKTTQPLIISQNTLDVLSSLWGAPTDTNITVLTPNNIQSFAWDQDSTWAIIPFEALNPKWKVISIDEQSPIRKDFSSSDYLLSIPISARGSYNPSTRILPPNNRNPGKLTTVILTGVTALVRATAYTMEQKSITYPAIDVGDWLQSADITHISNEVPFAEDCPFPDPIQESMRFCSATKYIQLMKAIGTDVVELTGDHFADWGSEAMLLTLELYDDQGWQYYGGGKNLKEGRKPITLEHNGNRIAFIGCNGKGGGYAGAGNANPGAVLCDFDYMESQIEELNKEGYLVIATFQHFEYYTYNALPDQILDFTKLANAGAAIVSGSQAHHPQAFAFLGESFVHYGLGNLFFDQYGLGLGTRQAFIDRHIFYEGKHISTELLTIMFIDYARPRPMTDTERQELLDAVFTASGW